MKDVNTHGRLVAFLFLRVTLSSLRRLKN